MQAAGVWKGQLYLPVSHVVNRHAHISKLRTSPLYCTAATLGLQFEKLKLQPSHGLLQVSSSVKEHTQQNNAGTKVVKVKFVLERKCEFGQQFCVIGDEERLGAWNPEASIPMQWSDGHIWTLEQDLSVGMCMEFKIILKAEQEVIEWQPGPNQRVEFSGTSSSLVVRVPWSDEEDNMTKESQIDTVVNESKRKQNGDETASSTGNPLDLVEDMESEALPNKSADVTEEQLSEERSTDIGMVIINAKDVTKEQQTEAERTVVEHREATDARISSSFELISSQFAIPESWYGEESEQMSEIPSSHGLTESSCVSVEDIAKAGTASSDLKVSNDNKEEEIGEQLMSMNRLDEVIFEGRASSMSEAILKEENGKEQSVHDVLVETNSPSKAETLFPDTKPKNTNEETTRKQVIQNGPVEVIAESRSETMISTNVSNNQDHRDTEVLVDNDPTVLSTEVPEIEKPSMTTEPLEKVEIKPLITAQEKKSGLKRWFKLWDAFVQGRNN